MRRIIIDLGTEKRYIPLPDDITVTLDQYVGLEAVHLARVNNSPMTVKYDEILDRWELTSKYRSYYMSMEVI
jgi:hypothetical protein